MQRADGREQKAIRTANPSANMSPALPKTKGAIQRDPTPAIQPTIRTTPQTDSKEQPSLHVTTNDGSGGLTASTVEGSYAEIQTDAPTKVSVSTQPTPHHERGTRADAPDINSTQTEPLPSNKIDVSHLVDIHPPPKWATSLNQKKQLHPRATFPQGKQAPSYLPGLRPPKRSKVKTASKPPFEVDESVIKSIGVPTSRKRPHSPDLIQQNAKKAKICKNEYTCWL